MAEPFLGEIKMVGFNFAPKGWAFCNGESLPITQNQALFSLLGIAYGGDGHTFFNLPDMRGRVPIDQDSSAGYVRGYAGGSEAIKLSLAQMPVHTHSFIADQSNGTASNPGTEGTCLHAAEDTHNFYAAANNLTSMHPNAIGSAGSEASHSNVQPSSVINFVIALKGTYPSRS
jgi:microcystin-dependent protein